MNIGRVKNHINLTLSDGITKDTMLFWLDDLYDRAKRGDKYEKLCKALEERYGYAFVHKMIDKSAAEVIQVRIIMAKLRSEFFGSKHKTRRQKINDVLYALATPGSSFDCDVLRHLLIELRDEEEDE